MIPLKKKSDNKKEPDKKNPETLSKASQSPDYIEGGFIGGSIVRAPPSPVPVSVSVFVLGVSRNTTDAGYFAGGRRSEHLRSRVSVKGGDEYENNSPYLSTVLRPARCQTPNACRDKLRVVKDSPERKLKRINLRLAKSRQRMRRLEAGGHSFNY